MAEETNGRVAAESKAKAVEPATTGRELWGYWMYAVGAAGFFNGTTDFVSVYIVDQSSRVAKDLWCNKNGLFTGNQGYDECIETGWAEDWANVGTCVGAGLSSFTSNSTCVDAGGQWNAKWLPEAGIVPFFGLQQNFQATFTTATTVSVILQLILFVTLGAIGDYGHARKPMFVLSNVISALAVGAIYFGAEPETYEFNASMVVIANTLLNFAAVMYQAWLPLLVRNHWDVVGKMDSLDKHGEYELLNATTTQVQGRGIQILFAGVFVYLVLSAGLFIAVSPEVGEDFTVRIVCVVCCVWLLGLSTISTLLLKARPGPRVPEGKNIVAVSVARQCGTFPRLAQQKQAVIYLLAYFIYSDGMSTMTGAAAVFAAEELLLGFDMLIVAYLVSALMSAFSAWFFVKIQQRYKFSSKSILLFNLFVLGLIPLYSIVALTSMEEFFIVTALYGFMAGSATVFGVSMFASNIIPHGRGAEYFALWQLTDKGTAWLGPLVLSIVSTQTGSYRQAFTTLVAFFYVGAFILIFYNPEKSLEEKRNIEAADLQVLKAEEDMGEE